MLVTGVVLSVSLGWWKALESVSRTPTVHLPDPASLATAAAKRFEAEHPGQAYDILMASADLAQPPTDLFEQKRILLERLVKEQPGETRHAIELAEVYNAEGKIEEAFALLEPVKAAIKDGEAARIYGQVLVSARRAEEAPVIAP